MPKKKVLIFGHNDATQFVDIYNQYTRVFDRAHYEVTVALLTSKKNSATEKRILADEILFLDFPKQAIRTLKIKAIRTLLTLCKSKHFDIVICHRYKPTYIMLWVAQFYKISALVFVMHELGTMASFARWILVNILYRDNMLFAGVSNAVRDDMRKSLPRINPKRIITLYNMIDVDATEPQFLERSNARTILNLQQDDFVFGSIARLAPNKDQTTLINAFAKIKPFYKNVKLVIIGDGDLENNLKALVAVLGIKDSVYFTGFLAQGFRYLKAFDCFVLSSTQEAFGRVLLEAMLAKLPIIATRVHGIPEVVGTSGKLTKPRDMHELAAHMLEIYDSSLAEREYYGEQAYTRVLDKFSIPAFEHQFWQLPLLQSLRALA